jgi:hypothetical protein
MPIPVPGSLVRCVPLIVLLLAMTTAGSLSCSGCCSECGSGAHYAYVCTGGLAQYCGTFCIRGSTTDFTIVSKCCCKGSSSIPTAPPDPLTDDFAPDTTSRASAGSIVKARMITSRYE